MDGTIKLVSIQPVIDRTRDLDGRPIRRLCVCWGDGPGADLLTAFLGGAVATQVRITAPMFSYELFGVYIGGLLWIGLCLHYPRLRALLH